MVYLAMWTPSAITHFISYHSFHKTPHQLLFQVNTRQMSDLIAAASAIATIAIRLSYKPIRTALLMKRSTVARSFASLQPIIEQ